MTAPTVRRNGNGEFAPSEEVAERDAYVLRLLAQGLSYQQLVDRRLPGLASKGSVSQARRRALDAIRAPAVAEYGAEQLAKLDALEHVRAAKSTRTWRAYGLTLAKFGEAFGELAVTALDPDAVAEWFTGRWGKGSAQGWNANRSALISAATWWRDQPDIPVTGDPFSRIGRRAVPPDRSRALDRAAIEKLLTSQKIPLRERCLWSLLYDSAARSAEVLRLDVPDLDLANHRSRVTRKGGGHDVIVWRSRTARLLSNYLQGRKSGPVFVTDRGAKSDALLGPGDRDERGRARLSCERAEALFREASGGATLHQLRHSALTHDAEDGASAPLLMTKSGHASIRTLGKYARPGTEALAAWQQQTDRTRRGRD